MSYGQPPWTEERGRVPDYPMMGTQKPRAGPSAVTILAIACFAVVLIMYTVSMLRPCPSREPGNRMKCGNNLRTIGSLCRLYAQDNGGHFPATLGQLIQDDGLSTEIFLCPSTCDERARGATTQETLAIFATPGHCSYIYLGHTLSTNSPKDAVLAYDAISNHDRDGVNVLYVDGQMKWLNRSDAASLIAELESGHNPPRPPNLRSATQPSTRP